MLSEPKTIILNGKLLGYIRIQTEVLEQLTADTLLVLERELNKGDATIVTFRLGFSKVGRCLLTKGRP